MILSIPRTFTLLRRPYLLLFSTTVLLAAQAAPIYCLSTPQQANQRWEEGDYEGAIEVYSQAIPLEPNDADAYNGRGFARYGLKDYQGAIEDYNEAIPLEPNDADAYNGRGFARYGLKDYQGAIEDYNEAIRLEPNFAPAYIDILPTLAVAEGGDS